MVNTPKTTTEKVTAKKAGAKTLSKGITKKAMALSGCCRGGVGIAKT